MIGGYDWWVIPYSGIQDVRGIDRAPCEWWRAPSAAFDPFAYAAAVRARKPHMQVKRLQPEGQP